MLSSKLGFWGKNQPCNEMLYVNTSMLYQSCWWWRGSARLMPTLLAQPPSNFLSFFFMSTIINESNNNCFGFFIPWLTIVLSSSRPSFSLYLSCLLYFYFLSWRDDVLQWCHIHNLHSTTYVHNHTNTIALSNTIVKTPF